MKGDTNRLSEQVARLLHGKNIAFVATLMKDGSPQITPTWVDSDGNEIVINRESEGEESIQRSENSYRDRRSKQSISYGDNQGQSN